MAVSLSPLWFGLLCIPVVLLFFFTQLPQHSLSSVTSYCAWISNTINSPSSYHSSTPSPPLTYIYNLNTSSLIPLPSSPLPYSSATRTCLLVRAYHVNYPFIPALMHVLSHNTHPPNTFFIPTDPRSSLTTLQSIVHQTNQQLGFTLGHVLNVTFNDARADFPELDQGVQDYGYAWTDVAINRLTSTPLDGQCEWLMVTNADNLYGSRFLDRIEVEQAKGYELIGMTMISRYDNIRLKGWAEDKRPGSSDDGTRHLLDVEWREGWMDLGAVMWKLSMWRERSLNFIALQRAVKPEWNLCDGTFFKVLTEKMNVSRVIIRQVLFIHQ